MRAILLLMIGLSASLLADFSRSNGVVADNTTGLQWQDDYSDNGDNIKSTKWTDAIAYCEDLTLGGHSDWRLPNNKELQSIVDYGKYHPSIDTVFTNTASYDYWSSTTRASYTDSAWSVHFYSGNTVSDLKSYSSHVRCVR